MPVNQFNKDFAKQFHLDHIPYTGFVEQQHDDMLFRQFSGNEQELVFLGNKLTGTIHDMPLIRHFINMIEKGVIPEAARLSGFITKLNNLFSRYVEAEPYTAIYYKQLEKPLTSFLEQTNIFQKDTDEHLLAKLKTLFVIETGQEYYQDIDSDIIHKIEEVIEYYLNNFGTYGNYFNAFIQQEHEAGKGIALTTQMAYYLYELVLMTGQIIVHLQTIREILFAWESKLAVRELQELYN